MKAESLLFLTIAVAVRYAVENLGNNGVENLSHVVGSLAWDPLRGALDLPIPVPD